MNLNSLSSNEESFEHWFRTLTKPTNLITILMNADENLEVWNRVIWRIIERPPHIHYIQRYRYNRRGLHWEEWGITLHSFLCGIMKFTSSLHRLTSGTSDKSNKVSVYKAHWGLADCWCRVTCQALYSFLTICVIYLWSLAITQKRNHLSNQTNSCGMMFYSLLLVDVQKK